MFFSIIVAFHSLSCDQDNPRDWVLWMASTIDLVNPAIKVLRSSDLTGAVAVGNNPVVGDC
jgi:hypothetical protein